MHSEEEICGIWERRNGCYVDQGEQDTPQLENNEAQELSRATVAIEPAREED